MLDVRIDKVLDDQCPSDKTLPEITISSCKSTRRIVGGEMHHSETRLPLQASEHTLTPAATSRPPSAENRLEKPLTFKQAQI